MTSETLHAISVDLTWAAGPGPRGALPGGWVMMLDVSDHHDGTRVDLEILGHRNGRVYARVAAVRRRRVDPGPLAPGAVVEVMGDGWGERAAESLASDGVSLCVVHPSVEQSIAASPGYLRGCRVRPVYGNTATYNTLSVGAGCIAWESDPRGGGRNHVRVMREGCNP